MENADPMVSSTSSSSSSSSQKQNYDVFLSFRGEDTCKSFTSHLREALQHKGFNTFVDDDRGEEISPGLRKAIEDSHYSVVVLSEKYAGSSWCLAELAEIVRCKGTSGKILPIFYHVDPSHVRKQIGSFGEAVNKHEQDPKREPEKVDRWKHALKEVASLPGWHVTKDTTSEEKFIHDFIVQISRKLDVESLNISHVLVGMDARVEELKSLTISPSSDTVQFIGIWGMGGIGKTTLAKVYYHQNFDKFDGSSFIENVGRTCETKENGLAYLQEQLLSNILKGQDMKVDADREVNIRRLGCKRVLIVLDDVDKLDQLKALADQNDDRFGLGSIVIVTTRDQSMLRANGISRIYEVDKLNFSEALKLFSWKAFKSINPPEEYKELCKRVVEYVDGLPLVVSVLGSFFGSKKRISEWESALRKLRKFPEDKIFEVLKLSFEDLEEIDKHIFLDIACFFNEYRKDLVIEILDSCGFDAEYGMSNLIEKSLLSINQYNQLHMHDLLQEMGREIVRNESRNEPGRQSRIWEAVDFCHILENKSGTDKVEAMVTFLEGSTKLTSSFKAISHMKNLRLLMILGSCSFFLCENNILTPELEYLSNELRWLQWDKFPFKKFPSSFRPYRLVQLKLFRSSIEELWIKHVKPLRNLKVIDLSWSQNLTVLVDFTLVPNLEGLILESCTKLSEVDHSITSLGKLSLLNLAFCTSLKKLPKGIMGMTSLEILDLRGCSQLCELPLDSGRRKSLKVLDVCNSDISCPLETLKSIESQDPTHPTFRCCK